MITYFCRPCRDSITDMELDMLDLLPICPGCGDDMRQEKTGAREALTRSIMEIVNNV